MDSTTQDKALLAVIASRVVSTERLLNDITRQPGPRGEKGDKGDKGEKGDPPAHEWKGTKLRFEHPDGTWGKYVDLRGPPGPAGAKGAVGFIGGGGGSSSFDPSTLPAAQDAPLPDQVLVQQSGQWVRATWAQMLDWIGAAPPVITTRILTEGGDTLITESGDTLTQG